MPVYQTVSANKDNQILNKLLWFIPAYGRAAAAAAADATAPTISCSNALMAV
jgi:hypothetical protein